MPDELPISEPPDISDGSDEELAAYRQWTIGALRYLVVKDHERNARCAEHATQIARLDTKLRRVYALGGGALLVVSVVYAMVRIAQWFKAG